MGETKRGGAGRGQGRKPIAKSGELMKSRPVRMTDEEWEKCKRLGGAAWVRDLLDAAKWPKAPADCETDMPDNAEVRGASRLAGEASSAEGATSTVVLERGGDK